MSKNAQSKFFKKAIRKAARKTGYSYMSARSLGFLDSDLYVELCSEEGVRKFLAFDTSGKQLTASLVVYDGHNDGVVRTKAGLREKALRRQVGRMTKRHEMGVEAKTNIVGFLDSIVG